eukprot:Nitzschia sp. Nitz4//scaffold203_size38902//4748//8014//NITZ4_007656-RA/size38902-processed-gene-0.67-mRNA-1//-1//CDS//3329541412//5284//frame0
MSRKQVAVERIKKKAAGPSQSSANASQSDPFHNGQTPTCRSLLYALHDIFPELQHQRKQLTPPSQFGQLWRAKILQNVIASGDSSNGNAPTPPLGASPAVTSNNQIQPGGQSTQQAKKKKKRKKKKKDSGAPSDSGGSKHGSDTPTPNPVVELDEGNDMEYFEDGTMSLNDGALSPVREPLTIESLDRSLGELELRHVSDHAAPDLRSLPSDDHLINLQQEFDDLAPPSLTFFERIQRQESTSPSKEKTKGSTPAPPPDMISTSPITPPPPPARLRSRTMSGSSIDFLDPSGLPVPSSPTHEWVPSQDQETAKPSTSEIVKNPLDLSFLRGCRDDLDMVPSTETPLQENLTSNWAITKFLYHEWVGQWAAQQSVNQMTTKDLDSFLEFVQQKIQKEALGVSFSDIQQAVQVMECSSCRQEAQEVLHTWSARPVGHKLALNPLVLNPASQAVDTAFDYVALEEGNHTPEVSPEDADDVDLNAHISFTVGSSTSKNSTLKQLHVSQLSSGHLDTLADLWLPCGVDEEVLVSTSFEHDQSDPTAPEPSLDYGQFGRVQTLALEQLKAVKDNLMELEELRQELQVKFAAIPVSNTNFQVQYFKPMQELDKLCGEYGDKLLDVLAKTTVQCGGTELSEQLFGLWTLYLQTLNRILKACDTYYDNLGEKLADQRGVLPQIFLNAEYRNMFQSFLGVKVQEWSDLGKEIGNRLNCHLLKEICTRRAWESMQPELQDHLVIALDHDCQKVVLELAGWAETLMASRMPVIMAKRMERTESMLELLQSFVEPLADEYTAVEPYFAPERNQFFASLRSNVGLAHGVKKQMRLIDNAEVEGMATGLVLIWRLVRSMQGRVASSVGNPPPLPLPLKRWILLQDENLFDKVGSPKLNSYHHSFCPSGGGRRRVMCMVVGLLYNVLEEQCRIWKAEQAEKELLTDFGTPNEVATTNHSQPAGGKGSKAKKNKKKKNKNSAATNATESINGNSSSAVEGAPVTKDIPPNKAVSVSENGHAETPSKETEPPSISEVEPEVKVNTTETTPVDDTEVRPTVADDEECDEEPVRWYLQDGKSHISAEDFLIGRMEEILRSSKEVVFFV